MESEETGKVLLGIIELAEAKRVRSVLVERGVNLELVSNPETCSSGNCAKTVEVFVSREQLPIVTEFYQAEKERYAAGLDFDAALFNEVYDPEKESARCPACGTEFSTRHKECPDCGLVFAG